MRRKQAAEKIASVEKSAISDPNVAVALDWSKNTFSSLMERVAGPQSGEARNERTRKYAEEVEQKYKVAVEQLDNDRLSLEEALAEHFHYVQRCESDRLKAATSVLRSFHVAISSLGVLVGENSGRVSGVLGLLRGEKDVGAIVESLRWVESENTALRHSHDR